MTVKKDDRRVRYTKMALKETLVQLLEQKTIDRITIKELCEVADVNRSTFYAHYSDQYDLLRQIEQEILQEINEKLSAFNFKMFGPESALVINQIFEYVRENAHLCRVLLGENGDTALQQGLMAIIHEYTMKEWPGQTGLDQDTGQYLRLYAVNGCLGIVQEWIRTGMGRSTSELADLVIKMTYSGLSAFTQD